MPRLSALKISMNCATGLAKRLRNSLLLPAPFDYFGQMSESNQDKTIYEVVLNHEEQYSIWPADRECPLGWRKAGKSGQKDVCLAYINEVWTDMRPLSVRKQMDAARSDNS
jgi:MbtH protein